MKLRELEASFRQWIKPGWTAADGTVLVNGGHRATSTLAEADGVMFLCPKCFQTNGGPAGTHMVICWFVGRVPNDLRPGPGRWTPSGNDLDDLTFVPGRPPTAISVALQGGCGWHGYVSAGNAT